MLTDKQKYQACKIAIEQYIDDLRTHTHCDHVLARHIVEFEALMQEIEYESARSSTGLSQLLIRHNFKPTGDLYEDLAIARKIMPARYGEIK